MVKIHITDDMKQRAKGLAYQRRIICQINYKKPFFQTNIIGNEYIGILGELIFHNFLSDNNIPHEFSAINMDGTPDEFDIKVDGKLIDVKTNLRMNPISWIADNYKMLINKKQFEKRSLPYYVFILIHDNDAYIMGYLAKDEVTNFPLEAKRAVSYAISINKLHSIEELLKEVK